MAMIHSDGGDTFRPARFVTVLNDQHQKPGTMKRLTREEADAMVTRPNGRLSWARGFPFGMHVGEIILVGKGDWHQKRVPSTVIKRMTGKNGREWTTRTLLDNSGLTLPKKT